MIWLLIPLIILALMAYLTCAPFYMEINSTDGLYRIRFHRLAYCRVYFFNSSLYMELNIAGWRKIIDLSAIPVGGREKKVSKENKKFKPVRFSKILAVLKSFRINKCYLTIDTGNMQTNGILYPIFLLLGMRFKKSLTINFLDENVLILQIENNIARMMWAFLKS